MHRLKWTKAGVIILAVTLLWFHDSILGIFRTERDHSESAKANIIREKEVENLEKFKFEIDTALESWGFGSGGNHGSASESSSNSGGDGGNEIVFFSASGRAIGNVIVASSSGSGRDGGNVIEASRGSGENGGGGNDEHGQLGTTSFINVNLNKGGNLLTQEEMTEISKDIEKTNAEQKIYNLEKFGPLNETTSVIVIQVHSRVAYLSLLVESLSRVRNIENSLVIFSHDIYSPELNDAIRNLSFTRIMQIFYPHSIQIHPNQFPGPSPNDCPTNINRAHAKAIKCINADHPDNRGRYRVARYPQIKHDWWWKANFVFDKLDALRNYTGVITFLEEDYYVTPDFLWMLHQMEGAMIRDLCHGCHTLSLGTYLKSWDGLPASSQSRVVVENYDASRHNMLIFNRTLFEKMQGCAPTFCNFDDYNWDWTLLHVSYTCLPAQVKVMYAKAPRIFHIGDCGFHYKASTCQPKKLAEEIEKKVVRHKSLMFPESLSLELRNVAKRSLGNGFGMWGDVRDKELCMSFVKSESLQIQESSTFNNLDLMSKNVSYKL